MRRLVRALFVWITVIALPLQAVAASTMLFCGPSHERMMSVPMLDASARLPGSLTQAHDGHDAHAEHAAHHASVAGHGDHHDHGRHDPAAAHHAALAGGGSGQGDDSTSPLHGMVSCSACAACCAAHALPAHVTVPEIVPAAQPVHAMPDVPVTSLPPDGLDRPPRTSLA